uniref:Uncharacterized protein n=1 Tax=Rhizophora mucronata TaxID=61149 RepID=A0A2P2N8A3_RHIMU
MGGKSDFRFCHVKKKVL